MDTKDKLSLMQYLKSRKTELLYPKITLYNLKFLTPSVLWKLN